MKHEIAILNRIGDEEKSAKSKALNKPVVKKTDKDSIITLLRDFHNRNQTKSAPKVLRVRRSGEVEWIWLSGIFNRGAYSSEMASGARRNQEMAGGMVGKCQGQTTNWNEVG